MRTCKHISFEFDKNTKEWICQWCGKTKIEIEIKENKKKKDEAVV